MKEFKYKIDFSYKLELIIEDGYHRTENFNDNDFNRLGIKTKWAFSAVLAELRCMFLNDQHSYPNKLNIKSIDSEKNNRTLIIIHLDGSTSKMSLYDFLIQQTEISKYTSFDEEECNDTIKILNYFENSAY